MESLYFSLSLDACLREAAPAKAGERAGARGASAGAAREGEDGLFPSLHLLPSGEGRPS